MKYLLGCLLIAVVIATKVSLDGQLELRAAREELHDLRQEAIGEVIVMVASGWLKWPDLPQCIYGENGKFTNLPCSYGGMTFRGKKNGVEIEVPLNESTPEDTPLPSWLWRVNR